MNLKRKEKLIPKEQLEKLFSILFIDENKNISPDSIQSSIEYAKSLKNKRVSDSMLMVIFLETRAYYKRLKIEFRNNGKKLTLKEFFNSKKVL